MEHFSIGIRASSFYLPHPPNNSFKYSLRMSTVSPRVVLDKGMRRKLQFLRREKKL
jgi:hypothetical protein